MMSGVGEGLEKEVMEKWMEGGGKGGMREVGGVKKRVCKVVYGMVGGEGWLREVEVEEWRMEVEVDGVK